MFAKTAPSRQPQTNDEIEEKFNALQEALVRRRMVHLRRSETRYGLVVAEAVLTWRSKSLRVDVENISSSGAIIRFTGPLDVGDDVHLEFDGFSAVTGTVQWVKKERVGIALEHHAFQISPLR